MSCEAHVRFCEGVGVQFPRATHLVILCRRNAAGARERMRSWLSSS